MDRLEQLTALYLEGGLSADEAGELSRLLTVNPLAASEFAEIYRDNRVLRAMLRPQSGGAVDAIMAELQDQDHVFVRDIMEHIEVTRTPRPGEATGGWLERIRGWRWAGWALLLGATAVLIAAAFLFFPPQGTPVITAVTGSPASVERTGERLPVRETMSLLPGDVLRTGTNVSVTVSFGAEQTSLRLGPQTELKIAALKSGKHFKLQTGILVADVARQRLFAPLVVTTPNAEATVVGTRFTLTSTANRTQLDVTKGRVRLADLASTNAPTVLVGAGQRAIVAAATQLAALPQTGGITREWWNGVSWVNPADSLDDPRFPLHPDGRDQFDRFEMEPVTTNRFGMQLRGYVHPPVTGGYEFWLAAMASAQLFLSPSELASRKEPIAVTGMEMQPREWDAVRLPRDGAFQRSGPIHLEAGKRYYIEAMVTVEAGEGHLSVAWKRPDAPRELLSGQFLSPAAKSK